MWEETLARSSSAECQYLKEATSIYCYLMLGITTGNITMHNITYKKYTYERTQIQKQKQTGKIDLLLVTYSLDIRAYGFICKNLWITPREYT